MEFEFNNQLLHKIKYKKTQQSKRKRCDYYHINLNILENHQSVINKINNYRDENPDFGYDTQEYC